MSPYASHLHANHHLFTPAHATSLCPSQVQAPLPGPHHHTHHIAVPLTAACAISPCLSASRTTLLCSLCQLTLCWCIFLFPFLFFLLISSFTVNHCTPSPFLMDA